MNVYDFDGTIYSGDSSIDFFVFSLKKRVSLVRFLPKQALGFLLYAIGRIDKTRLKEYYFCFLKGINGEKMVCDFWDKNLCKVQEWYLNQKEAEDIIISASPQFLVEYACKKIGVNKIIASPIDILSGKATGKNCKGKEKVKKLEEIYSVSSIDKFYSDSKSDEPLAKIAHEAYLVKKGQFFWWEK